MAQSAQLLHTLKRLLRQQGLTYARVAEALQLSESSVKRLFAAQDCSLRRLEQLCALLDLEVSELAQLATREQQQLQMLSEQQEAELVADTRLLLVTISLLNHWPPGRIVQVYRMTPAELTLYLLQLDRLGLIELGAGNRVRLRLARDFSWRPDGPIRRFFNTHVRDDFFASTFAGDEESLLFVHGMLTPEARSQLLRRMRRLVQEFNEQHAEALDQPDQAREGHSLLLALRPWEPQVFARLRREPPGAAATPA